MTEAQDQPVSPSLDSYLGDGVYASFDGYHVWLAVNHHQNKVVALDPDVIAALNAYVEFLKASAGQRPGEGL